MVGELPVHLAEAGTGTVSSSLYLRSDSWQWTWLRRDAMEDSGLVGTSVIANY